MPGIEDTRDWLFQTLQKPYKLVGVSYYRIARSFKIFEGTGKLLDPRHDLVISGEFLPDAKATIVIRDNAGTSMEWSITHDYLTTYPWFGGVKLIRLNLLEENMGTSVQNGRFVIN